MMTPDFDQPREPTSRIRILLAIYVNILIFGSLTYYLGVIWLDLPSVFQSITPIILAIFSFVLASQFSIDPGSYALGLSKDRTVLTKIRANSNWLVFFIGILFVSDGCKSLIRWHQMGSKLPYFGIVPNPETAWVVELIF